VSRAALHPAALCESADGLIHELLQADQLLIDLDSQGLKGPRSRVDPALAAAGPFPAAALDPRDQLPQLGGRLDGLSLARRRNRPGNPPRVPVFALLPQDSFQVSLRVRVAALRGHS